MTVATVGKVLAAPVDDVWSLLGEFGGWDRFLRRIEASRLEGGAGRGPVGAVRVLTLADGSTIRERLVAYDQRGRSLAYEFDGSHPFPVRHYVGRVELWPATDGDQCFVRWTGTFDCEAADEQAATATFARTYSAFLADLAAFLEEADGDGDWARNDDQ